MLRPLENNPEVLNTYIQMVGFENSTLEFVDVFGLSPDLLSMVPRPIAAFLLVYPLTLASEEASRSLALSSKAEAEEVCRKHRGIFIRQIHANSCGTIALLHAVCNNAEAMGEMRKDSPMYPIWGKNIKNERDSEGEDVTPLKSEEFAKLSFLQDVQTKLAEQGAEMESVETNLHFVCFTLIGDKCVELDGRKEGPMIHGTASTNEQFVETVVKAIQAKMDCNPDSFQFGITALVHKNK